MHVMHITGSTFCVHQWCQFEQTEHDLRTHMPDHTPSAGGNARRNLDSECTQMSLERLYRAGTAENIGRVHDSLNLVSGVCRLLKDFLGPELANAQVFHLPCPFALQNAERSRRVREVIEKHFFVQKELERLTDSYRFREALARSTKFRFSGAQPDSVLNAAAMQDSVPVKLQHNP